MDTLTTRRIIRWSAIWDLVVTAGFALPWTVGLAFTSLEVAHDTFGLSGTLPSVDDPVASLFANLTGSLVVVWALVRIARPELLLGAADTVARILFALAMATALGAGVTTVVAGFLVTELAWAVVQGGTVAVAYRRSVAASPTLVG